MVDIFVPQVHEEPNMHDKMNRMSVQIMSAVDARIAHFNTDFVLVIGVIIECLCAKGVVERERLIERLQGIADGRKQTWAGDYSPIADLCFLLQEIGKSSDEKPTIARIFDLIEGGLSKKLTPETTD